MDSIGARRHLCCAERFSDSILTPGTAVLINFSILIIGDVAVAVGQNFTFHQFHNIQANEQLYIAAVLA